MTIIFLHPQLFKSNGKLNAGFGTGYNIKSSIQQATLHSPFHIQSYKVVFIHKT